MVIILEGPNRCGKTTYAKMLQSTGFKYFKSTDIVSADKSPYRLIGMVDILRSLNNQGVNCVVDRFHLTDKVYGKIVRNGEVDISKVDKMCYEAGFILIYMTSSIEKIIKRGASRKTPASISQLIEEYEKEFEASMMTKYKMEWCEV